MVNEGDAIKSANSLMCFGSWIQPERGKIPINWGIQPGLLRVASGPDGLLLSDNDRQRLFLRPALRVGFTRTPRSCLRRP